MTLEFTESSASETIAYVASDAGQHLMHSSREVHREAAGTTTRRRVSRDELVTDADGGWPELIPNLRLRTNQGGMSRAQFDAVLELWTLARTSVPAVRKPGAGPSDDGTYYLAWSFSDVDTVVTVEVSAAGECGWFIAGGDESISGEGTPREAIDAVAASLPTTGP